MEDQAQYRHAYETTMRPDTPQEAAARARNLPDQQYMIDVQTAAMTGKLIQRRARDDPSGMWCWTPPEDNDRIIWNWGAYIYRVTPEAEPTRGGVRRWRIVQEDYGRNIRMAGSYDDPAKVETVELVTRAVP